MAKHQLTFIPVCLALIFSAGGTHADDAALWQALKDGKAIAMMRHALAPGVGDPANFDIKRCETQRNLDTRGREQAIAIGDRFRNAGIAQALVYTSAWCRCRDTATLLNLGSIIEFKALNSFFRNRTNGPPQIEKLRRFLVEERPSDEPIIWVTHQVNITGLTNVWPESGEIIVIAADKNGAIQVLGRIETAIP